MTDIKTEVESYRAYLTLANFKPSTVDSYCRTLEKFYAYHLERHGHIKPTQDHVQRYLLKRRDSGLSWSSINADYSSLRKYFRQLKDYEWSLKKLPRPKKDNPLPQIISKEEVALLISSAPTLKYQTFLSLLYATGMRLSEATNLRLTDIDSDRMQIRIHLGKGGKSRMVHMPLQHIKLIRAMRLCKTPALGGKAYVCKNCGQKHFVYHSCGKGGCCICQYKKSVEWVAKLQTKLFDPILTTYLAALFPQGALRWFACPRNP